ncbi:hypothetical protein Cni_G22518 [Canna indica]|uniref:Uncharacterized protein n=1 Tax=Canna indica TaxID=4628 RepID=A0AAQ3QMQ5_9LILI|nr:hypothetical protein Cni_G22518 [Canna indica]
MKEQGFVLHLNSSPSGFLHQILNMNTGGVNITDSRLNLNSSVAISGSGGTTSQVIACGKTSDASRPLGLTRGVHGYRVDPEPVGTGRSELNSDKARDKNLGTG